MVGHRCQRPRLEDEESSRFPNNSWFVCCSNKRLKDFLHFLWTCPFDSILVVGHACFLKQLLHGDKPKKMLGNCEGVITIMKNGKLKVIKEIKPDHN
jgi:hypothetical protein